MVDLREPLAREGEEGLGLADEVAAIVLGEDPCEGGLAFVKHGIERGDAAAGGERAGHEIEQAFAGGVVEVVEQTHEHDPIDRGQLLAARLGVRLGEEAAAIAEALRGVGDVARIGVEAEVVAARESIEVAGRAAADIEDAMARGRLERLDGEIASVGGADQALREDMGRGSARSRPR